ncbi:MAG: hypothetical protein HQK76_18200 [Desulfobacterales bacterium]|nr:hypothetical protein [Desulfobacterales bacterium]
MDCPKCGLSNMPGSVICFQCGSDLTSAPNKIETMPPRGKTSGLQQGLKRGGSTNRLNQIYSTSEDLLSRGKNSLSRGKDSFVSNYIWDFIPYVARGFLSIIPGFAQYLNGEQYKSIFFICVLLLFPIAFFIINTSFLFFAIGLFILFFAMIFDGVIYSIPKSKRDSLGQNHYIGIALFVIAGLFISAHILFSLLNTRFAFVNLNREFPETLFPFSMNESLIARKNAYNRDIPMLNDFVILNYNRVGWYGADYYNEYIRFGKIIGIPGDKLILEKDEIFVGDKLIYQGAYYAINIQGLQNNLLDTYLIATFGYYMRSPRLLLLRTKGDEISGKVIGVCWPIKKIRGIKGE